MAHDWGEQRRFVCTRHVCAHFISRCLQVDVDALAQQVTERKERERLERERDE